jgi:hypothetical protein
LDQFKFVPANGSAQQADQSVFPHSSSTTVYGRVNCSSPVSRGVLPLVMSRRRSPFVRKRGEAPCERLGLRRPQWRERKRGDGMYNGQNLMDSSHDLCPILRIFVRWMRSPVIKSYTNLQNIQRLREKWWRVYSPPGTIAIGKVFSADIWMGHSKFIFKRLGKRMNSDFTETIKTSIKLQWLLFDPVNHEIVIYFTKCRTVLATIILIWNKRRCEHNWMVLKQKCWTWLDWHQSLCMHYWSYTCTKTIEANKHVMWI